MADAASPWSPFRSTPFRVLWIATVVANAGTWVHDVGAAWLMTGLTPSPLLVALVQAATTLPVVILALPAGALADVFDRRRVLLAAQVWMTVSAHALALLTWQGATTPTVLLLMTFVLGIGTALAGPAWQSIVPELVPKPDVAAAVTLNSAGINMARAFGPALGGMIVAASGPAAAFALNGLSFLGVAFALVWWRRAGASSALPAEGFSHAIGVGVRYVRHNLALRSVLVRTFAFVLFGSALWALLPLIAREQLGTNAFGYGVLLGAIGVGALTATVVLPPIRQRLAPDVLIAIATLAYGGVMIVAALSARYGVVFAALLIAGAAWLTLLSTFQTGAQLTVPSWVRGRALAAYLTLFFGGQAIGATLWGGIAQLADVPTALVVATGGLVLGLTLVRRHPLGRFERLDLSISHHLPAHAEAAVRTAQGHRIVVTVEYVIAPDDEEAFRAAVRELRLVRLRSGADGWSLEQDLALSHRWIERFTLPDWTEHLRQHERLTAADRDVQAAVVALHHGAEVPRVTHWREVRPR